MLDLIKAFQIFAKYTSNEYPTTCEHDVLYVLVAPDSVSEEDMAELESLGFTASTEQEHFYSYKYGSA